MRKIIFIIFVIALSLSAWAQSAAPSTCIVGVNVYYVSLSGSDSNTQTQALSKLHPWKHDPAMASFTGSYTHTAGDCIFWRGGDTYSAVTDTITAANSGTSSATDYHGAGDLTWFTGSSFTRPIFSGGNAISTSFAASCTHDFNNGSADIFPIIFSGSYWQLDDIEISGICWSVTNYTFGSGIGFVDASAGPGQISNVYCHGWSLTSTSADNFPCFTAFYTGTNATSITIGPGVVVDGSDSPHFAGGSSCQQSSANPCASGQAMNGSRFAFISQSVFRYVSNISVTAACTSIHDNLFEYLYETYSSATAGVQHPNVMNCLGGDSGTTLFFYNNVIRNTFVNEGVYFAVRTNAYVFDNAFYNVQNCTTCSAAGFLYVNDAPTASTPVNFYYYNNTQDSTGILNFAPNNSPLLAFNGTGYFENNHFIGAASNCTGGACSLSAWYTNSGAASLTITDNGGEDLMTSATATAQGYVSATAYAPVNGSGSTIGGGNNLTSSCSTFSADAALCSGTSNGVVEQSSLGGLIASYPAITVNPRPSSGAWNSGAYQFAIAASGQTVTMLSQSGATVTMLSQSGATVTMGSASGSGPTSGGQNIQMNVLQSPGNTNLPWWNNASGVTGLLQTTSNAQVSGATIQIFDSDFDPMQVGTISVTNGSASFSLSCNNANDDSFDGCSVLSTITAILVRDTTNSVTIEEELSGALSCVSLNCTGTFTEPYPGPTNSSAAYSGFRFTWPDSLAASWSAAGKYVDWAGPEWVSFSAASNCRTASGNSYNYAGSSSTAANCGAPAKLWNLLVINSSFVECVSNSNNVYTPDWLNSTFQTYYQASMFAFVAHYARNTAAQYIRPAFGHGGESLPSNVWNVSTGGNTTCFDFWQTVLGSSSQATQTANWNTNFISPQLTYAASVAANVRQQIGYAPALMIGVTPMGVPNTQLPNLASPEAQALGIGFGSQGLEASDITGYPTGCTANWCGNFATFENSVVPLELQTLDLSCPVGITCTGIQASTGPLPPLLAFAAPLGTTVFELYYQDWLDAYWPTSNYCAAANGANYTSAQCNALQPGQLAALQAVRPTPSPITTDVAVNVLQAPYLGGLTGNATKVTDHMIGGASICRMTDTNTQTGSNSNFPYFVGPGGSADTNLSSLFSHFFQINDSGGNYFLRFLNWFIYNNQCNSLALYPNLDASKGNLITNAGEFSYTNDVLFYDHGSLSSPEIVQYNLSNYATPSITAPASLPTQTELANYSPVIGCTPQWQTLGGMDRNDALNETAFHLADAFSCTGGQNSGVLAVTVTTNAVTPSLTSDIYYVYNTGSGAVTEYTGCNNSSCGTTTSIGTVAIDDRFCIHNLKYHGYLFPVFGTLDPYAGWVSITANRSGSCAISIVNGNDAGYYFWQIGTTNVIPCVACSGHETELGQSFVASLGPSGQFQNWGLVNYATAAAGIVNTNSAGTLMTFVSGVPPNSSMSGYVAICPTSAACGSSSGVAYPITSCTSTTCTIVGGPASLTGVRYNYPPAGTQRSGTVSIPTLITFPTLWPMPSCTGSSFPYTNQPCGKTPDDTHISSNANPGNDTGPLYIASTTYSSTAFPRIVGMGTLSGGTFTSAYGGAFASSMVGGNLIVNAGQNGENCTVNSFISSTQLGVTCPSSVGGIVPYYLEIYPGATYDEVFAVIAGGVSPPNGYLNRVAYEYNSTFSPFFNTQNGIGSNGNKFYFLSTDWQCAFGTTNGAALSYCPTDWPGTGTALAANAFIKPLVGNAGGYIFEVSGGTCTVGATEPATWNQTVGGTSTDGGCTYTNEGQNRGDVVAIQLPNNLAAVN